MTTYMNFTIGYKVQHPEELIRVAREYLAGESGYDQESAAEIIESPDDALEELLPMCPRTLAQALETDAGSRRLKALAVAVRLADVESVDILERNTESWDA